MNNKLQKTAEIWNLDLNVKSIPERNDLIIQIREHIQYCVEDAPFSDIKPKDVKDLAELWEYVCNLQIP